MNLQALKDYAPLIAISIAFFSLGVSSCAFFLGLMNYRRDRAKVTVWLQWNGALGPYKPDSNERYQMCHIIVTNEGRRPISILHVGLLFPDSEISQNLLEPSQQSGVKLTEGDPPLIVKTQQDEKLREQIKDWRKVRAYVTDSTGKEYYSRRMGIAPRWPKAPTGGVNLLSRPDGAWYKRLPWIKNKLPNS
jgi:hypothetical protein